MLTQGPIGLVVLPLDRARLTRSLFILICHSGLELLELTAMDRAIVQKSSVERVNKDEKR